MAQMDDGSTMEAEASATVQEILGETRPKHLGEGLTR
jgi:hypothetical protein